MPKGYKTINVTDNTWERLVDVADRNAELEGLTKISLAQMVERLLKAEEDKLAKLVN